MPELPEVETVCRGLRKSALGRTIEKTVLHRAGLRFPFPANFAKDVTGHKIARIDRRSKYILMGLENDGKILIHLGMSGRLIFTDDNDYVPTKHDHAQFFFDNGTALLFNDIRRFGVMDYLTPGQTKHKLLDDIGLDPFSDWVTPQWLFEALQKRRVSMKNALMDQNLLAGLGNIYVSESLFTARIWPERLSNTVTLAEAKKLVPAIRKVLTAAIDAGGSSLRDYVQTDGELGFFQDKFQVYGRTGKPCIRCKTPIEKIVQAGRASFACPKCQK
ncbi:MAG: mutM [Alphaproteobacteria bacterium]|nr:mutM [Alphaproteobacteria bacterium]